MTDRYLPILLAEQVIELMDNSGASEAQKFVAIEIAKAMIPVLNGSTCDPQIPDTGREG